MGALVEHNYKQNNHFNMSVPRAQRPVPLGDGQGGLTVGTQYAAGLLKSGQGVLRYHRMRTSWLTQQPDDFPDAPFEEVTTELTQAVSRVTVVVTIGTAIVLVGRRAAEDGAMYACPWVTNVGVATSGPGVASWGAGRDTETQDAADLAEAEWIKDRVASCLNAVLAVPAAASCKNTMAELLRAAMEEAWIAKAGMSHGSLIYHYAIPEGKAAEDLTSEWMKVSPRAWAVRGREDLGGRTLELFSLLSLLDEEGKLIEELRLPDRMALVKVFPGDEPTAP